MHALGNDFVIIDTQDLNALLTSDHITQLSNRRLGIGFDQLLILQKSKLADVEVKIYNADGSEAFACGNGARCVAWLYMQKNKQPEMTMMIGNRKLRAWQVARNNMISINMGKPVAQVFNEYLGDDYHGAATVGLGNAHMVVFVDRFGSIDIEQEGPRIANCCALYDDYNIDFVQVNDKNHIQVQTFERGAGLTPACGSGACASVCAATLFGYCSGEEVTVSQKNGDLYVSYLDQVILTGEVSFVFKGEVSYSAV